MGKLRELLFGEYNSLERALKNPNRVKRLRLHFTANIDDFAEDFLKFSKLSSLYVLVGGGYSKLLPEQIGELKTLTELAIINVPFKEFPLWITRLYRLKRLYLRGFDFLELHPDVKKMDNLKELSLENCDFTIIPEDIRDLENLRMLSFNADWLLKVEENRLPEKLEELNVFRHQIDDKVLKELKEKRPLLKINFYDR
ncbi:leucine-rich repeat domain-containing protein [Flavobacterium suzhouense]|uniref:Disease resistance R13L4/SHOC-2-like LRR domain-containing protein n=1 Tax=Flavobacterium suzhouense TaxID=1529638 RepID=A0ABW5NQL3_9FLAO